MLDFIVFKRYPSSQKRKLFTPESQLWYWDEIGCPVRANKKPSIPIFGVHAINQSYPNKKCDEDLKQLSPRQKLPLGEEKPQTIGTQMHNFTPVFIHNIIHVQV